MARLCKSKRSLWTGIFVGVFLSALASSLLPVMCRQTKTYANGPERDSNNLRQTVVVATLDGLLPEHKNAIWCSTFQMAWDKLKQDIIREPIQIPAAQELSDRLNRSQFPVGSIEEKSYYTAAGFVQKGIIEQVQKEMRRRFPSEPVPTFDDRYRTLPDVILAYAYLNVDVAFAHPYYTRSSAFDFFNSTDDRTSVTAFCAQTSGPSGGSKNYEQVRDQVEVLYYDSGGLSGTEQFAVDLSKETQPYQVILARMPRCNTLGEAARMLKGRIAAFTNDANYEALRRLGHGDTLIVPDMLYKLTHHFGELLGKHLGNQKWGDYFFFEALQKIDFTLSRTGVVLKSQAHVAPTTSMKERSLHFDRPFLICVQKREPGAAPFFLMWVDNAELMKQYDKSEEP